MSVQAMSAVLDYQPDDWEWTAAEKFVLLSIANHANKHGAEAFPGWDTIAEETCLSPSTVARAIRTLRHKGVLSSRRSTEYGKFGLTVYAIHLPNLKPSVTMTDGPSTSVTDGTDVTMTDGPSVTVGDGPSVIPSVKPSVTDALRNQETENPYARTREAPETDTSDRRENETVAAWLERTADRYSNADLGPPVDDPTSPCYSGYHDPRADGTGWAVCKRCELKIPIELAEMSA